MAIILSYTPLCPITSIEATIADGLSDMMTLDLLRTIKIGNSTSHLEDATVGPGRERETLHRQPQHIKTGSIRLSKLVEHTLRHLGVAVDAFSIGKPLFLYLSCFDDTFTNGATALAWFHLGDLRKGYYRNIDMQVDSVEQRTTDL